MEDIATLVIGLAATTEVLGEATRAGSELVDTWVKNDPTVVVLVTASTTRLSLSPAFTDVPGVRETLTVAQPPKHPKGPKLPIVVRVVVSVRVAKVFWETPLKGNEMVTVLPASPDSPPVEEVVHAAV